MVIRFVNARLRGGSAHDPHIDAGTDVSRVDVRRERLPDEVILDASAAFGSSLHSRGHRTSGHADADPGQHVLRRHGNVEEIDVRVGRVVLGQGRGYADRVDDLEILEVADRLRVPRGGRGFLFTFGERFAEPARLRLESDRQPRDRG